MKDTQTELRRVETGYKDLIAGAENQQDLLNVKSELLGITQ